MAEVTLRAAEDGEIRLGGCFGRIELERAPVVTSGLGLPACVELDVAGRHVTERPVRSELERASCRLPGTVVLPPPPSRARACASWE